MNKEVVDLYEDQDAYRDSMATVDAAGKRIWLYPKKPKGRFYHRRMWVTVAFLILFFAGPLVKIGGQPLLLFNIFERKFVILGQLFLPQDFVIFGIGMLIFFVFIILFTVVYGRIFCGWICPQTVFMEMIFRPIENFFEGSGNAQRKFDQSPLTAERVLKKIAKHLIYIVFSAVIAHVTMAYLIGIEQTIVIVTSPPGQNLTGLLSIIAFTIIFYYVFARLREQVCITICPYGRLQGVLVNQQTSAIMYDHHRGEPRSHLSKTFDKTSTGDCIDCALCVQVCPTGIDIRNGIQLECTNCTACIDACDEVMDKIQRPKGLIKYASAESIENRTPFKLSRRAYAYSVVLVFLIMVEGLLLFNRTTIETTLLRVPGQTYQELPNDKIANLYNAQIVNKTFEPMKLQLKVNHPDAHLRFVGKVPQLPKEGKIDLIFFVEFPKSAIKKVKTPITISIFQQNVELETIKTNFIGPLH